MFHQATFVMFQVREHVRYLLSESAALTCEQGVCRRQAALPSTITIFKCIEGTLALGYIAISIIDLEIPAMAQNLACVSRTRILTSRNETSSWGILGYHQDPR
jgi:hypothetical protein